MLGKEGREKTEDSKEGSERGLRLFLAEAAFPALSELSSETRAGGRRAVLEEDRLAPRQAAALSALYGHFHIPAHQAFSGYHPSGFALAWEVGRAAVPHGLTAFLCKGQPGRCGEHKLRFATVRLKAAQLVGATTPTKTHLQRPPTHPPVLGSEAARRGSKETRASRVRLKRERLKLEGFSA